VKKLFSYLFIPQESNNFRAGILQTNYLLFLLLLYLLNQSFFKSLSIIKPGILGYSSEITAEKVLLLTNQERAQKNLTPLVLNQTLTASAELKATDMIRNTYWAHNSPEGKTPWKFFEQVNYEYSYAGENLAKDFADTESLVTAWMRSPTHRENILNTNFKEIGIAVMPGVIDGTETTLVVEHFGTPKNNRLIKEFENSPPVAISGVSRSFINPLSVSKFTGSSLFLLIVVALIVDGYYTLRFKNLRLTGSTTGHISFLLVILVLLLLSRQGTVL